MPACVVKFVSVIQGCPLWSEHNIIFLLQAGLARSGGGVESPPPGNYLPVDIIANPDILEPPYVLAEASAAALAWRSEVVSVAIIP